jgi:hypothetical protein
MGLWIPDLLLALKQYQGPKTAMWLPYWKGLCISSILAIARLATYLNLQKVLGYSIDLVKRLLLKLGAGVESLWIVGLGHVARRHGHERLA